MYLNDFVGMSSHIEKLLTGLESGGWRHAYLFSGEKGTGKRSIAGLCARIIHCTGEEKPCGECDMCALMEAGSHPDHYEIRPDKSIGIDLIRDTILKLSRKPFEGGAYTVIIEQADKMTTQAQNALLKTLESPVGDAVFFLLTDAYGALLSTIRSRAIPVRFEGISDDALFTALMRKGADPDRAKAVLKGAHGSVGRALDLLEDEGYLSLRKSVLAVLDSVRAPSDVFDGLEALIGDAERADAILQIMEDTAREQLRASASSDNQEVPYDPARLLMLVADAKKRLHSNVRWQSVLETLFFSLFSIESTEVNLWRQ